MESGKGCTRTLDETGGGALANAIGRPDSEAAIHCNPLMTLEAAKANFIHLGVSINTLPRGRSWQARHRKREIGTRARTSTEPKGLHVIVHGRVEVEASATKRAAGAHPKPPHVGNILPLDLTVIDERDEPSGRESGSRPGGCAGRRRVSHKVVSAKPVRATSSIRWEARRSRMSDDRRARTRPASGRDHAAANDRYGEEAGQGGREERAKKAAQTAAAKKKKPKSVGGWAKRARRKEEAQEGSKERAAKKAAKKTAKKWAKKTAKKTAKKSALKTLVRKLVRKFTDARKEEKRASSAEPGSPYLGTRSILVALRWRTRS